MSIYCATCGVEVDPAYEVNGVYCSVCGDVLEAQIYDNSTTFMSVGSGAVAVGTVTRGAGDNLLRDLPGGVTNSRELTINRAKRRIQGLAIRLNLPLYISDHALNVYKMALQYGLTKGRRSRHLAAACLYIACRTKKTPHMLMDFSEALEEDVFIIGHCFLKLTQKLNLPLPICEPFFYIRRFCAQLEFEEKYNTVVNTALHLVSAMKRDWMQTGRRPAGICAAAILISARIHGFRRTQEEVVRVARICGATLAKRLNEFDKTEAAQMTPGEFQEQAEALELGQLDYATLNQSTPPAFQKSEEEKRRKRALDAMKKLHGEGDEDDEENEEDDDNENETEEQQQVETTKTKPVLAEEPVPEDVNSTKPTANTQNDTQNPDTTQITSSDDPLAELNQLVGTDAVQSLDKDFNIPKEQYESILGTSAATGQSAEEYDASVDPYATENYEYDEQFDESYYDESFYDETTEQLTADVNQHESSTTLTEQQIEEDADAYLLEDVDDKEIDTYLITDKNEIRMKEEIWDSLNLEFLRMKEEKRLEKERLRAEKEFEPRARKRKKGQDEIAAPARSAAEAAASLLRAKFARSHLSGIDIDNLFDDTETAKPAETDEHGYGNLDVAHESASTSGGAYEEEDYSSSYYGYSDEYVQPSKRGRFTSDAY